MYYLGLKDMTLGAYYKKFNTRVAIADRVGCSFVTKSLLDTKTEVLLQGTLGFDALQADKKVNSLTAKSIPAGTKNSAKSVPVRTKNYCFV